MLTKEMNIFLALLDSTYVFSQEFLSNNLKVSWFIDGDEIQIRLDSNFDGWMGIGLGQGDGKTKTK